QGQGRLTSLVVANSWHFGLKIGLKSRRKRDLHFTLTHSTRRRMRGEMHGLGWRTWSVGWIVSLVGLFAPSASATLFVYDQTSAPVANLTISASITVDGGLGDLPTLNQDSNPIDFRHLLGLSLLAPGGVTYSLADFVERGVGSSLPLWNISPSGIS